MFTERRIGQRRDATRAPSQCRDCRGSGKPLSWSHTILAQGGKSRGFGGRAPEGKSPFPCSAGVVESGGCAVAERLMRPFVVVEVEVALQGRSQGVSVLKIAGVDQLVLQRAPEALDEDVLPSLAGLNGRLPGRIDSDWQGLLSFGHTCPGRSGLESVLESGLRARRGRLGRR